MKTWGQEDKWMKQVPRHPKCNDWRFLKRKKKKFIYLAVWGVSCGTSCGMLELLVVARKVLVVAREI